MMPRFLFFAFAFIVVFSCTTEDNSIKEGVIVYQIDYDSDSKEKPIVEVLPRTVRVFFKDNNTATKIDGFMGLFSLTFLTLDGSKNNYTLLRVLDKKYLYESTLNEPSFGYKDMGNMNLRFVNETKEIAGYVCNKAIATSKEMNYIPFVLYYTYDLDIMSPNSNNPFKELDGVLMKFQVELEGINMNFEATKVKKRKIDSSHFVVPEDYERVDYETMRSVIGMFNEK